MVISATLLTILISAPPGGVVRMAYGAGTAPSGSTLEVAKPGHVIQSGDRLETTGAGYAEFGVGGHARVRMSALTRVDVDASRGVRLVSGRIWVQTARTPLRVVLGGASVLVAASTSAVVERAPTGLTLAVRAGHGTLAVADATLDVPPGFVASASERFEAAAKVQRGGRALWELVVREARTALGDVGRLEAYVVEQALRSRRIANDAALGDAPFDGYADRVGGSDGGAAGALLEEAIRPPPFFDDEVPPKGPNVRVDVTFSEQ